MEGEARENEGMYRETCSMWRLVFHGEGVEGGVEAEDVAVELGRRRGVGGVMYAMVGSSAVSGSPARSIFVLQGDRGCGVFPELVREVEGIACGHAWNVFESCCRRAARAWAGDAGAGVSWHV